MPLIPRLKDVASTAAATTEAAGLVELATNEEAVAGTDTARAVTPAGVAAAVSAATSGLGPGMGSSDVIALIIALS